MRKRQKANFELSLFSRKFVLLKAYVMKRFLPVLFVFVSFFTVSPVFAQTGPDEEIPVVEEGGGNNGTHGIGTTNSVVFVYKTETQIIVDVYRYSGIVYALIIGKNGIMSMSTNVSSFGELQFNTTSLPSGAYEIVIYTHKVYRGHFYI